MASVIFPITLVIWALLVYGYKKIRPEKNKNTDALNQRSLIAPKQMRILYKNETLKEITGLYRLRN